MVPFYMREKTMQPDLNSSQTIRRLALLATIFGGVFIFETALMQAVYSSLDILEAPLSMYAIGPWGFVLSSGLVTIGISYGILSYLFFTGTPVNNRRIRTGALLLSVIGVCVVLVAVFPTDTEGVATLTGRLHVIAAHGHFLLLPPATLFLVAGLEDTRWRTFRSVTAWFSVVLIGTGVVLVFDDLLGLDPYAGLVQKSLIVVVVMWIVFSARYHAFVRTTEQATRSLTSR